MVVVLDLDGQSDLPPSRLIDVLQGELLGLRPFLLNFIILADLDVQVLFGVDHRLMD